MTSAHVSSLITISKHRKLFSASLTDIAFYTTDPPNKTETPFALRAPELILRQPFSTGIDIWSFGCLVYELITGQQLFTSMVFCHDQAHLDAADDDHMCQLNNIIGPMPDWLMSAWPRSNEWLEANGNRLKRKDGGNVDVDDEQQDPCVNRSLEHRFASVEHPEIDEDEAAVICQLIRKILVYDPAERPSAEELLKDPWFAGEQLELKAEGFGRCSEAIQHSSMWKGCNAM